MAALSCWIVASLQGLFVLVLRGIGYGMEFSVNSFDEGAMASVWLVGFDHLSSLLISEMRVWRLSV